MRWYYEELSEHARFNSEKLGKVSLSDGKHLMVGLNCFEPGQVHRLHAHVGADKSYYVVAGSGLFTVGEETVRLRAGALVVAPADVPHRVENDSEERLILLVTIAPPLGTHGR